MIQPTIGFIVYGVHKDGLKDPMGVPFIDDAIVKKSKDALTQAGLKVVDHNIVVATKDEARAAIKKMKDDEQIDMIVLFSGTWVWAAHLVGAIRDYATSGKAVLLWTHPGSQGWRPVGGLVMHGGLLEIGQLCAGRTPQELAEYVYPGHVRRAGHGSDLWGSRSIPVDANVWSGYRLA